MKGQNRHDSRRRSALAIRLKNLEKHTASKDIDKAKKAYKDISCIVKKFNEEIPSKAKECINKLGFKEDNIFSSGAKVKDQEKE